MAERTGLALSIQQPWAWLIVNGLKPVENRDWPTKARGWIGIHAGKKFDHDGYAWVRAEFPQIELPRFGDDALGFGLGGIVGRARLIDCVEDHDSPWFVGRYGFVFASAEPLPFRACRGMLGLFRPVFTEIRETTPATMRGGIAVPPCPPLSSTEAAR
jgi:ASCH domain